MYKLYVGTKNYSSWSLRGGLVTKLSGAPFEEIVVPLAGVTPNPANFAFSPSGMVPCLHDGANVVWDTLAIAEYLAERHPGMWPAAPDARAWARSITAEMHSGFGTLRGDMTMCIRERVDVRPWSPALVQNIGRVNQLWNESRRRFGAGGAFLCGAFSIADCFYAPVAYRFQTYGVEPEGAGKPYLAALLAHPLLREWEQAALAENVIVEADEPRFIYRDKLAAAGRL
jgi:glutathione S-transferase